MAVTYCYFNGKIMSSAQAEVSVFDIGLLRGFGIYEAMTTHNKKPFMLKEHLERFRNSATALGLKIPNTDQEISEMIKELIDQNGFNETNIKFILTGGATVGGIEYDYEFPTFCIFAEEYSALPEKYLKDGCSLITHEHERQYPRFKTTNYITGVLLQKERKEKKALEILYISKDKKVLECATSNFFIVKDGTLITAADGVLLGITRRVVIELAKQNGIPVEEREVFASEIEIADEAFLTASFKEVVPVVKVGDKTVGNGKVGETTAKILNIFKNFAAHY